MHLTKIDVTLWITVGLKLFEPCVSDTQCNGTNNAGNCTEIGNNTLCFCQDEYLDFKGKCIKGIFSVWFSNVFFLLDFKRQCQ